MAACLAVLVDMDGGWRKSESNNGKVRHGDDGALRRRVEPLPCYF